MKLAKNCHQTEHRKTERRQSIFGGAFRILQVCKAWDGWQAGKVSALMIFNYFLTCSYNIPVFLDVN